MQLRAFRDSAPLLLKIMATADSPLSTPPAGEEWDSLSIDEVSAAGLQNIDVDVDADATVQAESNSSSSASAENVKGNSGAVSTTSFNSGIQGLEGTNTFDIKADANIQGLAGTTSASSASTSEGVAEAFTELVDSAGIQDVSSLIVGGELNALGQSLNSISADAESVVGKAIGTSKLTGKIEGLEADGISVSSDAGIQGLAQLTNSADAATAKGASSATANIANLQGADLDTLTVGGIASIAGQANLSNAASSSNVDGGTSQALASLTDADGLEGLQSINVSSDAGLTGISGIDLTASSASTGAADTATKAIADAVATTLQGAELGSATSIGGVGTIGGQIDFNGSAASSNVTGEATATGTLANLAQGLSTAIDTTTGFGTVINSDGTIQGFANTSLAATADTTDGKSSATADGKAVDGASLGDLDIGGVGTVVGSANFAASADASNVTSGIASSVAQVESVDGLDLLNGSNGLQVASDAGIQGLADIALTAAGASTGVAEETTKATATADAGELQGAVLSSLTDIGGVGSITGQVNLTSAAEAANVIGKADGLGQLNTAEGLDLNATLKVASDATVVGTASIGSSADASTTNGETTATSTSDVITGADLSGGMVDIGGISSIAGQANFDLSASSTNVSGKSTAKADSNDATGLIGGKGDFGIDVASDSDLSGITIGSMTTDASSTAGSADASAGSQNTLQDEVIGAELPSLKVGGVSNLTGAAQLDASATASNVDNVANTSDSVLQTLNAWALAGQSLSVTGLTSGESGEDINIEADGTTTIAAPSFNDQFNIDITSDSALTAQAFSNLDATASSIANLALAGAGAGRPSGAKTTVTGIESGLDISVGGVSDLTAQAQGTVDAKATSVNGDARAFGNTDSIGVNDLEMKVASDSNFSSISSLIGGVDASTTDGGVRAKVDLDSTGVDGIEMSIGGVNDFSAISSVTANSDASNVDSSKAESSESIGDLDSSALTSAWIYSASDSEVSGIATIDGGISASSTAKAAVAEGDFDADGITDLKIGVGGMLDLAGQSQVSGDVSASSVSGAAEAASGANVNSATQSTAYTVWAYDSDASTVSGLKSIDIDVASDATILGTAFGDFSTTAESTGADATANAAQTMRGIEDLNLNLGGSGTINAIVSDTSYVSASSVSGNASATASVNAIGLDGGDIQIAGDATIVSSVNVESDAVASTVG